MNSVAFNKAKTHYENVVSLLNEMGKQVQDIDNKFSLDVSIKQFDLILQTIMLNQVIADGNFGDEEKEFIEEMYHEYLHDDNLQVMSTRNDKACFWDIQTDKHEIYPVTISNNFFGEISLNSLVKECKYTVRAQKDTVLAWIKNNDYFQIYKKLYHKIFLIPSVYLLGISFLHLLLRQVNILYINKMYNFKKIIILLAFFIKTMLYYICF